MADFNKPQGRYGFVRRGEPQVWATSGALTLILATVAILLVVVAVNGLGALWPSKLVLYRLADGSQVLGEIAQRDAADDIAGERVQLKIGNRDMFGLDFRWVSTQDIVETSYPVDAATLERVEYGNFYGFPVAVHTAEGERVTGEGVWRRIVSEWEQTQRELETLRPLDKEVQRLGRLLSRVRADSGEAEGAYEREARLQTQLAEVVAERDAILERIQKNVAVFRNASGTEQEIALADIVRMYRPNEMSAGEKVATYGSKLAELLTGEPRESNTEGGLFPAIFGTVMLVFLMSLFSFPLGVVAGVYLREYARDGLVVRLVRIAVNNLAGIPSIVYGIFGLGFFIYGIGGTIDQLFFSHKLPTPTFGTGGILWASMTLGLLTIPVVIVATEEALGAIPQGIREGSLSLGATKFQTLMRILLPMSSPGIMTGFILAMARAAGEVAPLMITGVVKLAPALPVDGEFPYFHADRKFMHLGFHIYDIGFQSPNVEAAKPMVYMTTLLLVLIVLVMSSAAIYLRERMKKRYTVSDF